MDRARLHLGTIVLLGSCPCLLWAALHVAEADDARGPESDASPFGLVQGSGLSWLHLSSKQGDLPVPGESTQQTGAPVADLDQDGVNDFVLSFREKAPALDCAGYRLAGASILAAFAPLQRVYRLLQ